MTAIQEPEFVLLPAVTETRIRIMQAAFCTFGESARKTTKSFGDLIEAITKITKELSTLAEMLYQDSREQFYAKRRVRKLVQKQKRRRL